MRRSKPGWLWFYLAALFVCWNVPAVAQSSQASLQGRVTNAGSGAPIAKALVIQRNLQTNVQSVRYSNEQGLYSFAAVPPGVYSVRVYALEYQPEDRSPVELPVSSRIELDFALKQAATGPGTPAIPATARPGQAAGAALAMMYGADAAAPQAVLINLPVQATETLVGSLSSLIDERKILELALSGRDVYTLLVLQPGVTSDNATQRGLGFSVNGQRPASSNFLLDGVDNNDLIVTGPATRVSADAVKEYRMSTNNYSAEFGRASGFIANAITRTGTNEFHGTVYEFFNHDRLNANSFGNNLEGLPRQPFRQNQFGGAVGGPLARDRAFFFGNFERFRSSSRSQELQAAVPSAQFVSSLAPNSKGRELFTKFPPPQGDPIPGVWYAVRTKFALPFVQRNTFGLGRVDYSSANGKHRLTGRYSISQGTREDSNFSVYPDLNSPLVARGQNVAANYTRDVLGGSNELKFGLSRNSVRLPRPHPETPTIGSSDVFLVPRDTDSFDYVSLALPGSEAAFDYKVRDLVLHFLDNFTRLSGRHSLGFGFEWRHNLHGSYISPGRDGFYIFSNIGDLVYSDPWLLQIALNRQTGAPASDQDFQRSYRQKEFAAFVQDNLKLTRRLTLNLGLRFEYFGVPAAHNGTVDYNFALGQGHNIGERLAGGRLETGALYRPDRNNVAPRLGFALDLRGNGKSVLRGGYGIFYDRIFNSFWMDARGNALVLPFLYNAPGTARQFEFTFPARMGLKSLPPTEPDFTVLVDRGLRTPYGQDWFVGLQHAVTPNLVVEVNQAGSLGRKLLASDIINRAGSLPIPGFSLGRFNNEQRDISYRSNQGLSDYASLQVSVNRRWSKGIQFQASYTFSRTRDVQSEPSRRRLAESQRQAKALADPFAVGAAFTRQFDSHADYGNSDFDQAHNLVFNVIAQAPRFHGWRRVMDSWQVAVLAGFRSGFPFSVYSTECRQIEYCFLLGVNRADFLGKDREEAFLPNRAPIRGGMRLLDKSKFRAPAEGTLGNLPRNAFRGPGFWNADFAVSRMFSVPGLPEHGRIQFRAEFFNLFNHTNLNNPDGVIESPGFGEAFFGRLGFGSALPGVSPLNEQPRRIQFALKLYF